MDSERKAYDRTSGPISRRFFLGSLAFAGIAMRCQEPAARTATRSIPLIEIHSHILDDDGARLVESENLSYLLTMAPPDKLSFVQKQGGRFGACVWLDPRESNHLDVARRALKDYPDSVKGFKLHPAGQQYDVTYDRLAALFELANERDCMIQSHTAEGTCNASRFLPLLEKFPRTKLVLLHGFPAEEAFRVVNSFENVYIDNSYTAWGREYQQAALRAVGKTKLLFGIDSPLGFPSLLGRLRPHFRDAAEEVADFYGNQRDVVEHVFYKNALKLLGLQQLPS